MTDFETSKKQMEGLVEKFKNKEKETKKAKFDEENTKMEFINEFFRILGWDVDNKQGDPDSRKEVQFEHNVRINGKTKAVDYCFKIDGKKKFFVEAKKPSVNIKDNKKTAHQIKRYTWNASLPLGILTDFEELSIYEPKVTPKEYHDASIDRINYYTYADYVDKWEEIYNLFSKDAVLGGAIDEKVGKSPIKKETVTSEFLKTIEEWRLDLARNIALRNKDLTVEELNYSVQLIIDRIIFLRIAEDRGIERYGRLKKLIELAKNEKDNYPVYEAFIKLCKKADLKYNSGLFHFTEEKDISLMADNLTPTLKVDDGVLKKIIKGLYYPDSPFEFSIISTEILGNIYEQFLGKVIRLTEGHQAKVEDKPDVKKAGGVYYTPQYIVEYIVENTIGELLKGKTPNKVSELKFVDPACGSGSFLLGAYQKLLDWHIEYYSKLDQPPKKAFYIASDGIPRLTIQEKKRILLNNIYGVDIDSQAVEVTKLSLLLKVLEDENKDELEAQQKLIQERALPYLGDNIRCGNSLIGMDILDSVDLSSEEIYEINPFDWEVEFPEIFENGGFDAVIGNPPYIKIQTMKETSPKSLDYYKSHYISAKKGNYDIYVVFVEKAINLINKNGKTGYILPHKFFNAKYGKSLRELIKEDKLLDKIVHFGDIQIFLSATTYTCLLFLNYNRSNSFDLLKVENLNQLNSNEYWDDYSYDDLDEDSWIFLDKNSRDILRKIDQVEYKKLNEIAKIFQGLATSADKIYVLKCLEDSGEYCKFLDKDENKVILESELFKPFLKNIKDKIFEPYMDVDSEYKLLFPYKLDDGKAIPLKLNEIKKYPKVYEYLLLHKKDLLKRSNIKSDNWWIYPYPKNLSIMEEPKLIIPVLSLYPRLIYDDKGFYMTGGGGGPFYGLRPLDEDMSILYLMGILNSKVFNFYVSKKSTQMRGGYFRYSKQYIEHFPIPLNNNLKIIKNVEEILNLNKQLQNCRTPKEKRILESQISKADEKVNQLVYELYDLTDEEIAIINEDVNKDN